MMNIKFVFTLFLMGTLTQTTVQPMQTPLPRSVQVESLLASINSEISLEKAAYLFTFPSISQDSFIAADNLFLAAHRVCKLYSAYRRHKLLTRKQRETFTATYEAAKTYLRIESDIEEPEKTPQINAIEKIIPEIPVILAEQPKAITAVTPRKTTEEEEDITEENEESVTEKTEEEEEDTSYGYCSSCRIFCPKKLLFGDLCYHCRYQ